MKILIITVILFLPCLARAGGPEMLLPCLARAGGYYQSTSFDDGTSGAWTASASYSVLGSGAGNFNSSPNSWLLNPPSLITVGTLTQTVTTRAGFLTFWYKSSTASGSSALYVRVVGPTTGTYGYSDSATFVSNTASLVIPLGAGSNTITFEVDGGAGASATYIDDIRLPLP